jgi:hypothetical protein
MRAKVTSEFDGVLDGEIYPRTFLTDDEIAGDLARTAVASGKAVIVEDDTPEEKNARRRRVEPLPPQPNNPPSPAAVGQAGLPPAVVQVSQPTPGTETALPANATADGGASTIEGVDTPSGGKSDADVAKTSGAKGRAPKIERADVKPTSGAAEKASGVEQKSPVFETQKVDGPAEAKADAGLDEKQT